MLIVSKLIPEKIKRFIKRIINQERYALKNTQEEVSYCICCGSSSILKKTILWDSLIKEWELSEIEARYIDRQQGVYCKRCKANLRTMAIANGIMRYENFQGLFLEFIRKRAIRRKRILEINNAGWLTQYLEKLPNYTIGKYPEVDMQDMPYDDLAFDIVVHSDTLEHVKDPIAALKECERVLKSDGYLIFTVPMVLDRITRSREGLPISRHGSENELGDDYIVHTEFGADAWKDAMEAGFSEVRIYSLEFPAAQCILCKK